MAPSKGDARPRVANRAFSLLIRPRLFPVVLAGAESPRERVPGPGSAERRSRSDAAGALDAAAGSGTIESEKDGSAQHPSGCAE
jgi:hypothetical protein